MKRKLAVIALMGMLGINGCDFIQKTTKKSFFAEGKRIDITVRDNFGATSYVHLTVTRQDSAGNILKRITYSDLDGMADGFIDRIEIETPDTLMLHEGWRDRKILRAGQADYDHYFSMGGLRNYGNYKFVASRKDSLDERERKAIEGLAF